MQCLTRCYATGFTRVLRPTFSVQARQRSGRLQRAIGEVRRLAVGGWRIERTEVVDAEVNQKSETLFPVAVSY